MPRKSFPEEISLEEREEILAYLTERFGFSPSLFEDYLMLRVFHNYWLFPKTNYLSQLRKLTPEAVGLIFLRRVSQYLKPTSTFLQRFGRYATKNIVTLKEEELRLLQENKKIALSLPLEEGYVILRDENWILGCGLYLRGFIYSYLENKVMATLLS